MMSASRIPLVAPEELNQSWRGHSQKVDAAALENALRQAVTGEVRFDAGSRALYATDGSNYRQVPIGVVIPRFSNCRRESISSISWQISDEDFNSFSVSTQVSFSPCSFRECSFLILSFGLRPS